MPLLVNGGRVPTRWAEHSPALPPALIARNTAESDWVRIALINNMPDAALEDTELQFFQLLETAAGPAPVWVDLFSLPGVIRGERGTQHLNEFYHRIEGLSQNRYDGAIITGTEPHHLDLKQEPYWSALVDVFDWAERHTASTVLSCLAAHAGVLHSDGITRHLMWYKMCGVFECRRLCDHAFLTEAADPIQFPHSRWNYVREDDLTACGYTVLTQSVDAGVDCFIKRKKNCLFVHFQGHPEYEARTLFKEYRRDVRRFLTGALPAYPSVPRGYFDAAATRVLTEFRERALAGPREELMQEFPEAALTANLHRTWSSSATSLYRNWFQYMVSRRSSGLVTTAVQYDYGQARQKDFALP